MGRNRPHLLHGTFRIQPEKIQVLANMRMPLLTSRAGTARTQRTHHNRIAFRKTDHTLAHFINHRRALMTDHPMRRHPCIHRTVIHMHIRPANTTIANLQPNLTGLRLFRRIYLHGKRLITRIICCFHLLFFSPIKFQPNTSVPNQT